MHRTISWCPSATDSGQSAKKGIHILTFTIRCSDEYYKIAHDKQTHNICVSWVSCTILAFPLRLQWWLMITYCEKFCIQNKQTLQFTLLNFSPSLCGINDFKLWKPAFMLCILRRSLLLAISRLIFFSCSMWVLPGMDCDLQ